MSEGRKSILAWLDDSIRWTGMPERVAAQTSGDPDNQHKPLRWRPIWPIVYASLLFGVALAWPGFLDRVDFGALISMMVVFWCALFAMTGGGIHANGPLGTPSLEDDERQAALRRESFLFCLGILAALNMLGQPVLLILSQWQEWTHAHTTVVVTTAFMLNAALWTCLPTLYASWKLQDLPTD